MTRGNLTQAAQNISENLSTYTECPRISFRTNRSHCAINASFSLDTFFSLASLYTLITHISLSPLWPSKTLISLWSLLSFISFHSNSTVHTRVT